MFKGSITAMVTPFKDGKVDVPAFKKYIDWQINEGSHGLSPCGTTGEGSTLSLEEHKQIIETCVEVSNGRVPIIAGISSNNTSIALKLVNNATTAGANGVLAVTPYYNKPTDEGIFQHYKAIHDESNLPMVLYNVPGRTGIDISFEVLGRIKKYLPNVVGIKDASSEVRRVSETRHVLGHGFAQLSGDDPTVVGFRAMGGVGSISVTSNIAPRLCADLHEACDRGDYSGALKINDMILPIYRAIFIETSPTPIKFALSLLGVCEPDVRLPLVKPLKKTQGLIASSIAEVGLGSSKLGT